MNYKHKATSIFNITLHFIAAIGFAWFAWRSWIIREGNTTETFTAGVFAGVTGMLALLILIDAIACIKARIKIPAVKGQGDRI